MTSMMFIASGNREIHGSLCELYSHIKRLGGQWKITAVTMDRERRHQLRKLFNGPMLLDFAQQGDGGRHTKAKWKELLADMFIEPEFDDATNELIRPSTESLSDDDMSLFILQCAAFGVMECGIYFTEEAP